MMMMKGHYYMLLALHFLKHVNIEDSKKYIKKSIAALKGLQTYDQIAIHDYIVLKNTPLNKIQVKFCTTKTLSSDTFYLDSRM